MIAFADRTRIALASEEGWGQAPSGAFTPLPLIAESLRPELSHIRPQSLGVSTDTSPVLSETLVSGDIEGLATTALFRALLPYILMTQGIKWQADTANSITDSNGYLRLGGNVPSHLKDGDFVWLTPHASFNTQQGFYPIIKKNKQTYIGALPKNSTASDSSRVSCHLIEAGDGLASFSLMRAFGTSDKWTQFSGMCIQRLVIDASEGSLMTATASLIGRDMSVDNPAPTITETDNPPVLELARSIRSFRLMASDETLNQSSLILTGFRLVLERVGMAPYHALGSTSPRLINQGRFSAYGSLEIIINSDKLFAWLTDQDALAITILLQDEVGGGLALNLKQVKLTGVENLPRSDEAPIAARFAFSAEAGSDGETARFFMHYPDILKGE